MRRSPAADVNASCSRRHCQTTCVSTEPNTCAHLECRQRHVRRDSQFMSFKIACILPIAVMPLGAQRTAHVLMWRGTSKLGVATTAASGLGLTCSKVELQRTPDAAVVRKHSPPMSALRDSWLSGCSTVITTNLSRMCPSSVRNASIIFCPASSRPSQNMRWRPTGVFSSRSTQLCEWQALQQAASSAFACICRCSEPWRIIGRQASARN